jgi:hypothetical protein
VPDLAPCAERLRLSSEVVAAVQVVYDARHNYDRAEKTKKDTAPYVEALAQARSVERIAVHALDQHRKEHGC